MNTQHDEMPYFVSYSCIKCWRCMCFFKLCRWCNCNGDTCVCEMEITMMRRRRRRKGRSFWQREKEVVNLSWMIEFLSVESSDRTKVCLKQRCVRDEVLLCCRHERMLLFFKGLVRHFGKRAFLLSCGEQDEKIDTIRPHLTLAKKPSVFPQRCQTLLEWSRSSCRPVSGDCDVTLRCFKQSRRFSGCQSRTTVPLIRSCFPPRGGGK